MWENHTGVLCLCPPPNQKGQKKEQSHCAGVVEREQQLQRADGSMRTSSIPGARGRGAQTAPAEHWKPSAALPTKGFFKVVHYLDVTHCWP